MDNNGLVPSSFLKICGHMSHVAFAIPSPLCTNLFISYLRIISNIVNIGRSHDSFIRELNVSAMLLSRTSHLLLVLKACLDHPFGSIFFKYAYASGLIPFNTSIFLLKLDSVQERAPLHKSILRWFRLISFRFKISMKMLNAISLLVTWDQRLQ